MLSWDIDGANLVIHERVEELLQELVAVANTIPSTPSHKLIGLLLSSMGIIGHIARRTREASFQYMDEIVKEYFGAMSEESQDRIIEAYKKQEIDLPEFIARYIEERERKKCAESVGLQEEEP